MSHNVLINGTSHKIGGGSCKVNGTQYKLNSGKTLIGGTSKNIKFTVPIPTDLTDTYWRWDSFTTISTEKNSVNYDCTVNFRITVSTKSLTLWIPFVKEGDVGGYDAYSYAKDFAKTDMVGIHESASGYSWGTLKKTTRLQFSENADLQYFRIVSGTDCTDTTLINYLVEHATQCDSSWNPL